MAMIYSEVPCAVAGTFTTNIVKAAPVKWDQHVVYDSKKAQAVIVNAGIANACTGEEGMGYCKATAEKVNKLLQIPTDEVLVASTGVIGMQLPIDRICAGVETMVPQLNGDIESGHNAALAIMTTDTHEKEVAVEIELSGKTVTIGGMCKGSGMIHPNMCTMLSFVTTDAAISQELLLEALKADVEDTYNMISVDGDTSTNDTCLLLANGMAENTKITEKNADYETFTKALRFVNETLAKQMAGDGEGATALFEVKVIGAETKEQAKIGYVAAYPYAEVISGYTAFLLGVRSVVPDAVMTVRYTNKWNDYRTEKKYAKDLIDEGCVIISQHSDTAGPATACEETAAGTPVYLVSYNQSMEDVAPTTYLTGCKINWEPYMMGAVDAVLNDRVIEKSIKGTVNGNDIGAGFEEDWVQMLELNEITAADGTVEKMQKVIRQFEQGKLDVFRGDYVGADPDDPDDTYDLNQGYTENEFASAPSFHYVLKDVIRIEE